MWASPAHAQRVLWWAVGLVGLPLALFAWWVILQAPSRLDELSRVQGVQVWHEDVGRIVFDQPSLSQLVRQPPDWQQMQWQPVTLPNFVELGTSVDLPADAPKKRAWFRLPIPQHGPDSLDASGNPSHGRLGLLGLRVQGGPWAIWADGQLIQANLADWRIQWNVPLRVAIPLGAKEVLLAVPYAEPIGFSVGSIFIGPMDTVDTAWQERNLWYQDLPRLMAFVALLLMVVSLHLAWARRKEPMFALLAVNALVWSISSLQFVYDVTGQDTLSIWLASAVDSSITWGVVVAGIFAFEFQKIQVTRLRVLLLLYACISTILTLPMWDWQKNALMAQQYFNMAAYVVIQSTMAWHLRKGPHREGVVMLVVFMLQLALGVHTLENLSNQTNPDSFYSYSLSVLLIYLAFTYAMSRRTVQALAASEEHEAVLLARLAEQQKRLDAQHARMQQMEVTSRLQSQRAAFTQDVHDHVGSNLTTAVLQARSGQLPPEEMAALLEDLAQEVRYLGSQDPQTPRSPSSILAELRERTRNRLRHTNIQLTWDVDPTLPTLRDGESSQHLRALVNQALANTIKHANATQIHLQAHQVNGEVVIVITDNGQGFDPQKVTEAAAAAAGDGAPTTAPARSGRGLPGMHRRTQALGAQLHIDTAPGQGCRWQLTLPAALF
ncbi:MAG: hypothetical protein RIS44_2138 [Pseudomonadota bacterium]|jgi:signal transduction histidine kinase